MTHATDPIVLADTLRHWALRFLAALLELLAFGPFQQSLRRWAAMQLTRAERGVMGLVLLVALRKAPTMPPPLKRAARPLAGPRGFHCRPTRETRVAQMVRGLFPRGLLGERNLIVRARRLAATLADLNAATGPVLRRLLRTPLLAVIVAVAPPAAALSPHARDETGLAHDTS